MKKAASVTLTWCIKSLFAALKFMWPYFPSRAEKYSSGLSIFYLALAKGQA
jgi:hypothetical protein